GICPPTGRRRRSQRGRSQEWCGPQAKRSDPGTGLAEDSVPAEMPKARTPVRPLTATDPIGGAQCGETTADAMRRLLPT
ncbi:MAG: hypothetical protein AAF479_15220, partial [Pseudomonadota bacterium]